MSKRKLTKNDFINSLQIASALKDARKKRGVSAKFVAGSIGISAAYLSDIEAGRRCITPSIARKYRKLVSL